MEALVYIWYMRSLPPPPPLGVRKDLWAGLEAPNMQEYDVSQRMPSRLPGYPTYLPVDQRNCGL